MQFSLIYQIYPFQNNMLFDALIKMSITIEPEGERVSSNCKLHGEIYKVDHYTII